MKHRAASSWQQSYLFIYSVVVVRVICRTRPGYPCHLCRWTVHGKGFCRDEQYAEDNCRLLKRCQEGCLLALNCCWVASTDVSKLLDLHTACVHKMTICLVPNFCILDLKELTICCLYSFTVGCIAQQAEHRFWPANFPCPTLGLQVTALLVNCPL